MATRTEQADLELALYSGHGEFPRALFAPGTIESAFSLTQEAFRVASKFQTPAIVLTDQYFVNSFYNVRSEDLSLLGNPSLIPKTGEEYRRYEDTPSGCSPFGVPGWERVSSALTAMSMMRSGTFTRISSYGNACRKNGCESLKECVLKRLPLNSTVRRIFWILCSAGGRRSHFQGGVVDFGFEGRVSSGLRAGMAASFLGGGGVEEGTEACCRRGKQHGQFARLLRTIRGSRRPTRC